MNDRLDRYARGELSPQEARALAQSSLESPDLFDELTNSALAKTALNPRTVRIASGRRTWRRPALLTAGLVAAAALVLIALPRPASRQARNIRPVLDPGAGASQPVLLASGLAPANATVFRGGEAESRTPRAAGLIVSLEEDGANLDLGSLDGLANGSELLVFRGSDEVGRLQVTAVFRERARARVADGKRLRAKDEVRVAGADHLNALLQQVDAAFHRDGPNSAIQLAEEAVRWGGTAGVAPSGMAAAWNHLAVLELLRGELDSGEANLLRAASAVSQADAAFGQVQNNLGALAEMRGEREKAAVSYSNALSASAGEQRQTVERNLTRVRGSR